MDDKYRVLEKLYELVADAPHPTQYQCIPRQLILLLPLFDWSTIFKNLVALEHEGLVLISEADNVQFAITKEGIAKAGSLTTTQRRSIKT